MTTYETGSSAQAGPDGEGIKEKASDVAADVGAGAKNVAGVAKDEASHVAHEAKSAARTLLSDARAQLTDQASAQKQRAADGLRSVGSQFSSMADGADSGAAGSLVRNLSQRADSAANWLSEREPGDIVQEVRSFARRNTGLFLALAAGVGVVAGRVAKALHSGDPEEGGEYGGSPSFDETPVATAVAAGQGTGYSGGVGSGVGGDVGGAAGTVPAGTTGGDPWATGGQGDRP